MYRLGIDSEVRSCAIWPGSGPLCALRGLEMGGDVRAAAGIGLPCTSVSSVCSFRLVGFTVDHVPAILETMRDEEILRFTRTPDPMPGGWLEQWLSTFEGDRRVIFAILDEADVFCGYAVSGVIDREELEVELGYAVSPWARGRGAATSSLVQLTRWAFAEGMQRVTALISVDNPASSRVAEKAGYSFEGVLRSKHHVDSHRVDLQSWSILPGELRDDPHGPS